MSSSAAIAAKAVPIATARTSPRRVPARVSKYAAAPAISIVAPTATMCVT